VAAWSARAALLVINVIGVLGALSVLLSRPSRRWRSAPRAAHWLGALRSAGLLVLVGAFFFVGVAQGSIAVAAVAYADGHGGGMVSSYLLSAFAVGALIGGLVYGARQWPGAPESRLRLLMALLALGYLPLWLVPDTIAMTLLTGLAGISLAPALACAFVVVDRHAPKGTVTEAFSWLVTAFGVGSAVGMTVVGPAVEGGGPAAGFAVAGAGGVAALLVLLSTGRFLAAPVRGTADEAATAETAENDRNGAVEPGFRAGHQA
jgi:predicted MFS family arabinose efflux permease